MVSTYTDSLRLNKQGDNDNPDSWGEILNDEVIELIEEAIVGNSQASVIDLDGEINDRTLEVLDGQASDVTGGGTNKARCGILRLEGALGNEITINFPTRYKWYIVSGQHTGFDVKLSHSGTTNEVTVSPSDVVFVYTDATDIYLITRSSSGAISGEFLERVENLDDVPNKPLAINNLGVYPVGSIYMSTNSADPSTLFGGTWQAVGQGRVLMGAGTSTNDDNGESLSFTAGDEGGEFNTTLTEAQLPSHAHSGTGSLTGFVGVSTGGGPNTFFGKPTGSTSASMTTPTAGGDEAHNNIQPYLVVYMWERLS
jgi:hypothetical protein